MRDTSLEPIRRNAYVSEDEENDEERDRRRRAAWNITPEGASNDSDDIRTSISIDKGFPVRFSCEDFVDESMEQKAIDLQFAYEVSVSGIGTTSFADNMRALEWSILWNVVKELDLHRCDFTRQDALVEKARRVPPTRLLQSTGPSYVVALGSGSNDKVDLAVGTCAQVQSDTAICVPMVGTMSAIYVGDGAKIEVMLLDLVQRAMNTTEIHVEDVVGVSYVPKRIAPPVSTISGDSLASDRLTFSLLGVGLSISLFVFALALVLLIRTRRRRLDDDKTDMPLEITVPETDLLSAATSGPDSLSIKAPSTVSPASDRAVNADDEDESEEGAPFEGNDGLIVEEPNVPPMPSNSVYLASNRQGRRKKMKKKKRKKLRSKVSLAPSGIDTIHEEDDDFAADAEHDEDSSDYSCSTDDEDTDFRRNEWHFFPGWGRSSPASPPMSPPSVPDTESPTKRRVFQPRPATNQSMTPIREADEKPKVKRLPPPWV